MSNGRSNMLVTGDKFSLVLLLKVKAPDLSLIHQELSVPVVAEGGFGQNVKCEKVLFVLGKYDLAVVLSGSDLGAVSRLSYLLLERLESNRPGELVDFTRIPLFDWPLISNGVPRKTIAIVQIKLGYPLMSFRDKGHTLLEYLGSLRGHCLNIYGGLAWYEILVDLGGESFDEIPEFIAEVIDNAPNPSLIGEISSIPAWDPRLEYSGFNMEVMSFLKIRDFEELGSVRGRIENTEASLGFIDLVDKNSVGSLDDLESLLSQYNSGRIGGSVRRYSSTLMFPSKKLPSRKGARSCSVASGVENDKVGGAEPITFTRRTSVLQEKIDAVKVQISVLRNDSRFSYLLPKNLVETLDAIELESSFQSPGDVAGYISTLRHAIHQRLAGTYPTAAAGVVTGYADGYGGYQRIILAAECLLSRCLKIMLGDGLRIPPVIVLFDQRGLHQSDFSIYEAVRKVNKGAPLIVRLRSLKYEPWFWHRGIRDIALWCLELEKFFRRETAGVKFLDFQASSVGKYACRLFSRGLYVRLRAFEGENQVAKKSEDGYLFSRSAYDDLRKEVAGGREILQSDLMAEELLKSTREQILAGFIFSDELSDDRVFRHFVNAYYSSGLELRQKPRVVTAFILSLYSHYRFIVGEESLGESPLWS